MFGQHLVAAGLGDQRNVVARAQVPVVAGQVDDLQLAQVLPLLAEQIVVHGDELYLRDPFFPVAGILHHAYVPDHFFAITAEVFVVGEDAEHHRVGELGEGKAVGAGIRDGILAKGSLMVTLRVCGSQPDTTTKCPTGCPTMSSSSLSGVSRICLIQVCGGEAANDGFVVPEKAVEQVLVQIVEPEDAALLQEIQVEADHLLLLLAADLALALLELRGSSLGSRPFQVGSKILTL